MRGFLFVGLITSMGILTAGGCADNATHADGDAGSDGAAPGCQSNAECKAADQAIPLCSPEGECVACLDNADCADPAAPTCDPSARTCRPCAVASDCDSQLCFATDGVCAAIDDIYYVDDDADCVSGDGSQGAPFCTILEANSAYRATPRDYVLVMAGWYDFPAIGFEASHPTWVGDPDAVLLPDGAGVCLHVAEMASVAVAGFHFVDCLTAVLVDGASRDLVMYGPRISGGDAGIACIGGTCYIDGADIEGTENAIRCEAGGTCDLHASTVRFSVGSAIIGEGDSIVTIESSTIEDTGEAGVVTSSSHAVVLDSVISRAGLSSMDAAVSCDGPTCLVMRSRIRSASGAGIVVGASVEEWTIENCAIVENGTITDGVALNGGVVVRTSTGLHRFANNTVYGNKAGAGETSGVRCAGGTTLMNSIVWGNSSDQIEPGCIAVHSDIDEDLPPLFENFRQDPRIANTTPGLIDEHLMADSPCIDTADSATSATDDIDGDARPVGADPDVGADERTP